MSRRWLLVVLIVVLAMAAVVALLWRRMPVLDVATLTKPHEEELDMGALVTRVRELSRLETASMHVVQVSTITQSYHFVPNALAGDELTLYAAGDVIAGVDLSQIGQDDVRRDPDGVLVLHLPPPQILVTRVDNRETRVISRKTGMLRREDLNLEGRARQHAEEQIRIEAVRKGVLPMAEQNAETKLAQFLHTLGAQRVRFELSPAVPSLR